MVAWQKAGRSAGQREVTRVPSTTAGSSTTFAPAFLRSVLTDGQLVAFRPLDYAGFNEHLGSVADGCNDFPCPVGFSNDVHQVLVHPQVVRSFPAWNNGSAVIFQVDFAGGNVGNEGHAMFPVVSCFCFGRDGVHFVAFLLEAVIGVDELGVFHAVFYENQNFLRFAHKKSQWLLGGLNDINASCFNLSKQNEPAA